MMKCSARRHDAAPDATIEWYDVAVATWRPLCPECLAIVKGNRDRARASLENQIEQVGFDAACPFQTRPLR